MLVSHCVGLPTKLCAATAPPPAALWWMERRPPRPGAQPGDLLRGKNVFEGRRSNVSLSCVLSSPGAPQKHRLPCDRAPWSLQSAGIPRDHPAQLTYVCRFPVSCQCVLWCLLGVTWHLCSLVYHTLCGPQ